MISLLDHKRINDLSFCTEAKKPMGTRAANSFKISIKIQIKSIISRLLKTDYIIMQ